MEADILLRDICRAGWMPPPRLRLSEWADAHAVLSAESSASIGRWKTLPYQRGIMDAITDRNIRKVSVMKSARVGWSKIINHTIGFHMHHDPCPMMLVLPTIGDAEGYSKDEIAPMLRDTQVLEGLVLESGRRDTGNTILHKVFQGGNLTLVGADSPRGFRRVSKRVVAFDEVDGYAPTAGEEGDQIKLGIMRALYFWNRKILAGSTPTLDQSSRIKKLFEKGDMRYFNVPCPECRHLQVLRWENLRWEKRKPETVRYHCEGCGVGIEYKWQRWMVEQGDRLQLEGCPGAGWVATNPDPEPEHASFHIWAGYSYAPNATWETLAREWLDCHKNTEERKTFINTVLGLPYKGEGDAPDWKKLYDRREPYKTGQVPAGGLVLFAGVDVQADRIEVEIVAFGDRMRSWSVDYRVIPGDTSVLDGPNSPFRKLDDLLDEWFPHELGGELQVRMLAIDTGFRTHTVYQWVRGKAAGRVIAVDGRGDSFQLMVGQPKAVEINPTGKKKIGSVKLWPIGTALVKTEIYGWLKQEKPTAESGDDLPRGYCHFPEYPEEYFKQLTAEEIVPRLVKGFRRYQWENVYGRNEALDCRVYARAASALLGIDRWSERKWEELREAVTVRRDAKPAPKPGTVVTKPRITKANDDWL